MTTEYRAPAMKSNRRSLPGMFDVAYSTHEISVRCNCEALAMPFNWLTGRKEPFRISGGPGFPFAPSKGVSLLPPRSTAGQLTLAQHIGVRIPGGQPKHHFPVPPRPSPNSSGQEMTIIFNSISWNAVRGRSLRAFCSQNFLWVQSRVSLLYFVGTEQNDAFGRSGEWGSQLKKSTMQN